MLWSKVWANAYAAAIAGGIEPKEWRRVADVALLEYKKVAKTGAFEQ